MVEEGHTLDRICRKCGSDHRSTYELDDPQDLNPSPRKFKVTQTRSVEIIAEYPGDAADLARFIFRGDPIPLDLPGWSNGKIKIIALEVDEA